MLILRSLIDNKFLLLIVLLSVISSHSLFHSGLLPTHDGEYHVVRFFEFDKALRDGNIYPRWAQDLNNGFGLPLFNFVYPLPNYASSFFHTLGFSFIDSFKVSLIFASLAGSIFMFLWTREFWGDLGGFISSVFYTYSPYHFLDIYIRGSVGEVWALSFFPAFLWTATKFSRGKEKKYFMLSGVFLTLIILSHNILAFMFFFLALSYLIFLYINSKRNSAFSYLSILVLGIGISSIFWLPALFEKQYVRGLEIYDYSKNFPELYQLIVPSWGSGFSSDIQNNLSFQIGLANLIAVILGTILIFKRVKYRNYLLFSIICFLIVFFMMLKVSSPVWQIFPFLNFFQFPWRFLSLEILFASFIAGSLINIPKKIIVAGFLIVLSVFLGLGYTNVAYYLERNDNYYLTRSNFIDGTNSPGNSFNTVWMGSVDKQKQKIIFKNGSGVITKSEQKTTSYSFSVKADRNSNLLANIAYFPGWNVYEDGKLISIKKTADGLFEFPVISGAHKIIIKFEDTPVRQLAFIISLISILALFVYPSFVRISK